MSKKLSIMLVFLLLFINIAPLYSNNYCLHNSYTDNSAGHLLVESKECPPVGISIEPRIAPRTLHFLYIALDIEKEEVLSDDYETIITVPKFRPQKARSNVSDENSKLFNSSRFMALI